MGGSAVTAGAGPGGAAGSSAAGGGAGAGAVAGSAGSGAAGAGLGGAAGAGLGGAAGAGLGGAAGTSAGPAGASGSAGAGSGGGGAAGLGGTGAAGIAGAAGGGLAGGGMGGSAGAAGAAGAGGGSFDPCPAAEPCRILPLGDSITDGFNIAGGYRIELFRRSLQASKQVTFVGRSMNGPTTVDGQPFPRSHEGHSGWTIQQIDDIVPSPALGVNPDIILLHIGTNDMFQGSSGASSRLQTLIDQILEATPDALLVVSTIIPLPGATSAVNSFNSSIPGMVESRRNAGKHILLVDQFTGFPISELADNVHPNTAGYARMAGVWFDAISSYLH